jgi:hypothetical protein
MGALAMRGVQRKMVVTSWCGVSKATDGNARLALTDIFGEPAKKCDPGPTYVFALRAAPDRPDPA